MHELRPARRRSFSYLRHCAALAVLLGLLAAGYTVVAVVLIDRHPDSGPALFAVQITGLLGGPVCLVVAVAWLIAVWRRRRLIRQGEWVRYPARSACIVAGPLRVSVIAVQTGDPRPVLLFPEAPYVRRIRRAVTRDGAVLVLGSRRRRLPGGALYAAGSGAPLFRSHAPTGRARLLGTPRPGRPARGRQLRRVGA